MSHPYPLPYPSSTSITRPSFISVARHIYYRDGYSGFFRGLGPCLLRAFPVNASAFFVYEGMMRFLGAEKVFITLSYETWLIMALDRHAIDIQIDS